jgi:putative cardiolipin synthase
VWRNELIWAWNQALWDAPSKVLADDEPDPQLLLTSNWRRTCSVSTS